MNYLIFSSIFHSGNYPYPEIIGSRAYDDYWKMFPVSLLGQVNIELMWFDSWDDEKRVWCKYNILYPTRTAYIHMYIENIQFSLLDWPLGWNAKTYK